MVPCEAAGDDACPWGYPAAEPTEPAVWDVWDLYFRREALGEPLAVLLPDWETRDADSRAWILEALAEIEWAVRRRQTAQAKPSHDH